MRKNQWAPWLFGLFVLATGIALAQSNRAAAGSQGRVTSVSEKDLIGEWSRYFEKSAKPIQYFTLDQKSIVLFQPISRKSSWAISDNTIYTEFDIEGQYSIKVEWKILVQKKDYLKVLQTWSATDISIDTIELIRNAKERTSGLEAIRTFVGHSDVVNAACFSPDGRYILSGSFDGKIILWDTETGREKKAFTGHTASVRSVAFSPDGRHAISGSANNSFRYWDITAGKEVRTIIEFCPVNSVCFAPDGKSALLGLKSGSISLRDLSSGKDIGTFSRHDKEVSSVCHSRDGKYVLSGSYDKTLKLWDAAKRVLLKTFIVSYKESYQSLLVNSVSLSNDGKYALSGDSDHNVKLWDIENLKWIRTFTGHTASVRSVCFSPDGKFILSGSEDGTVKLWEISSGNEIMSYKTNEPYVYAVNISPDGRYALSAQGKTIKLWDIASVIGQ